MFVTEVYSRCFMACLEEARKKDGSILTQVRGILNISFVPHHIYNLLKKSFGCFKNNGKPIRAGDLNGTRLTALP